jgi:hypothetical protein
MSLTPKDIHDAADYHNIKWDEDPAFMLISEQLTSKKHLDDMSQEELQSVFDEITHNPAPFTKNASFYFKTNYDYSGKNYLEKIKIRLERLSEKLSKDNKKEAEEIGSIISSLS